MAIFHLHIANGSRGGEKSAVAKSLYITRQEQFNSRRDLAATGSGNLPAWAKGAPLQFWGAVDEFSRANGRLFTEIEAALPNALTLEQQQELIDGFLAETARRPSEGLIPYEWAVHAKKGNHHVHITFSPRIEDGLDRDIKTWFSRAATGSKKGAVDGGARSWSSLPKNEWTAWLNRMREAWARHTNSAFVKAKITDRIDHRSHEERGLDAIPTKHYGCEFYGRESRATLARNARRAEIMARNELIMAFNEEHAQLKELQHSLRGKVEQENRDAAVLHVSPEELLAVRKLITPESPGEVEKIPGLARVVALQVPAPIANLQPRFVTKTIVGGQVVLHIRMPADRLAFVERAGHIRLKDGYDTECMVAMLQVAASEWSQMRLTGPIEFQRDVLEEAKRLGLLGHIQIPPEFASGFQGDDFQSAAATTTNPRPLERKTNVVVLELDQLKFLDIPASPLPANMQPSLIPPRLAAELDLTKLVGDVKPTTAQAADPATYKATAERLACEVELLEMGIELKKMSSAQLLDLKNPKVQDIELSLSSLERLLALMLKTLTPGALRFETNLGGDIAARRQLAEMATKELASRKKRPITALGQKEILDEYMAAVRSRAAALARRLDVARYAVLAGTGTHTISIEERRARLMAGLERRQVSRGEETWATRSKALKAITDEVTTIKATAPKAPGLLAGGRARAAYPAEVVEHAKRLAAAVQRQFAAKAALAVFTVEVERAADEMERVERDKATKVVASGVAEANELHRLRCEIDEFPKQLPGVDGAIALKKRLGQRYMETPTEIAARGAMEAPEAWEVAAAGAWRGKRDGDGGPPKG